MATSVSNYLHHSVSLPINRHSDWLLQQQQQQQYEQQQHQRFGTDSIVNIDNNNSNSFSSLLLPQHERAILFLSNISTGPKLNKPPLSAVIPNLNQSKSVLAINFLSNIHLGPEDYLGSRKQLQRLQLAPTIAEQSILTAAAAAAAADNNQLIVNSSSDPNIPPLLTIIPSLSPVKSTIPSVSPPLLSKQSSINTIINPSNNNNNNDLIDSLTSSPAVSLFNGRNLIIDDTNTDNTTGDLITDLPAIRSVINNNNNPLSKSLFKQKAAINASIIGAEYQLLQRARTFPLQSFNNNNNTIDNELLDTVNNNTDSLNIDEYQQPHQQHQHRHNHRNKLIRKRDPAVLIPVYSRSSNNPIYNSQLEWESAVLDKGLLNGRLLYNSHHKNSSISMVSSILPFKSSADNNNNENNENNSNQSNNNIGNSALISTSNNNINNNNNNPSKSIFHYQLTSKSRYGTSYGHLLSLTNSEIEFNSIYHAEYLDNPNLKSARHRVVMHLPGLIESVISYVRLKELKNELNDKFHLLHLHENLPLSMTLSKIRRCKSILLDIGLELNLELSTIALSYCYFEKLILRTVVEKTNRKLVAAVCLLLAYKYNEAATVNNESTTTAVINLKHHSIPKLLSCIERNLIGVRSSEVLKSEFEYFILLSLNLSVESSILLAHFRAIMAQIEEYGIVRDYTEEDCSWAL